MSCDLLAEAVVEAVSQMMVLLLPSSQAPIFLMSSLPISHRGAFTPKAT